MWDISQQTYNISLNVQKKLMSWKYYGKAFQTNFQTTYYDVMVRS